MRGLGSDIFIVLHRLDEQHHRHLLVAAAGPHGQDLGFVKSAIHGIDQAALQDQIVVIGIHLAAALLRPFRFIRMGGG